MERAVQESEPVDFDPEPFAIPFLRKGASDLGVGSGFLARKNREVCLYTAAHVPLGVHAVATPGWDGWPLQVGIYLDFAGKPHPIDMFATATIPAATPRFRWAPEGGGSPYMMDVIKFDSIWMKPLLSSCQERFEVVDLDSAPEKLEEGESLVCVGFPLPDNFHTSPSCRWPYAPPGRRQGPFWRQYQNHIQAHFTPSEGFSGGPVFTLDGNFAGIVTGENDGVARIIPPHRIRSL